MRKIVSYLFVGSLVGVVQGHSSIDQSKYYSEYKKEEEKRLLQNFDQITKGIIALIELEDFDLSRGRQTGDSLRKMKDSIFPLFRRIYSFSYWTKRYSSPAFNCALEKVFFSMKELSESASQSLDEAKGLPREKIIPFLRKAELSLLAQYENLTQILQKFSEGCQIIISGNSLNDQFLRELDSLIEADKNSENYFFKNGTGGSFE